MGELGNELGNTDPDQRLVQRDLTWSRRQDVLAAQHVGDLHQGVVDRIHQGVQRISAAAGQREVRDGARGEGGVAAHQVVPGDVRIGHPQPHHRPASLGDKCAALGVREVAVEVVVAQLGISARGDVPRLDLLRRRERFVRLAGVQQPLHDIAVDLAALGLPVRRIRSADVGALVPVQPEPAQRVQQGQIAFLAVARGVGVLEPKHERAARVAGVGPVEQRGADQADMWRARRRRAEPNSYVPVLLACAPVITFLCAQRDWSACRCPRQ